jgi:hypothetical protein
MVAVHITKYAVVGAVVAYLGHVLAQVVTDVAWLLS